jgi:hypothetical protein
MFSRKVQHALSFALLFFVISSPMTYRLVDKLVGSILIPISPYIADFFRVAEAGTPTTVGLLVHSAVFGLVAYALMGQ